MAPTSQYKHANQIAKPNGTNASFNPFYSPPAAVDFMEDYEYNKYKVRQLIGDIGSTVDKFQADVP
jgi:hypothetical protein